MQQLKIHQINTDILTTTICKKKTVDSQSACAMKTHLASCFIFLVLNQLENKFLIIIMNENFDAIGHDNTQHEAALKVQFSFIIWGSTIYK